MRSLPVFLCPLLRRLLILHALPHFSVRHRNDAAQKILEVLVRLGFHGSMIARRGSSMNLVVFRILPCKCGVPAMLPQDALGALFDGPDVLPNDSHAIGVVCPACRIVGIHFLEHTKGTPTEQDRAVLQEPFENIETFCEAMLRCEEPTCRSLLPIVLQVNRSTTDAAYRKYRTTWNFAGLTCPNGHSILKPHDW